MVYGSLHFRIEELLEENGISKNKLCKDLGIKRSNLNNYCKDGNARLDVNFICKLCYYFNIEIQDLINYNRPQ